MRCRNLARAHLGPASQPRRFRSGRSAPLLLKVASLPSLKLVSPRTSGLLLLFAAVTPPWRKNRPSCCLARTDRADPAARCNALPKRPQRGGALARDLGEAGARSPGKASLPDRCTTRISPATSKAARATAAAADLVAGKEQQALVRRLGQRRCNVADAQVDRRPDFFLAPRRGLPNGPARAPVSLRSATCPD